mmetsp:Transcript_13414/g.35796  ORF Transcript_13414/g.35796 Transcript_13414/m.35796 type:complete len:314 (+) Transcript_13414:291-1232(+)
MLKKYSTSSAPSSGRSVQWTTFLTLLAASFPRMLSGCSRRATSGSAAPATSRSFGTDSVGAGEYVTSAARHTPEVSSSTYWAYSGTTPLYTSRNSSALGRLTVKVDMVLITKPAPVTMPSTCPRRPALSAWGRTRSSVESVQLGGAIGAARAPKSKSTAAPVSAAVSEHVNAPLAAAAIWPMVDMEAAALTMTQTAKPACSGVYPGHDGGTSHMRTSEMMRPESLKVLRSAGTCSSAAGLMRATAVSEDSAKREEVKESPYSVTLSWREYMVTVLPTKRSLRLKSGYLVRLRKVRRFFRSKISIVLSVKYTSW